MIKRIAVIFGAVFVVVGVLGFVPGVTLFDPDADHGRFLGVFAVDPVHNLVHMVTGIIAIGVGITSEVASRMYFRIFGVIYAIVALLGFGFGNAALFGVMSNNLPDAILHTLIATAALFLGFGHLPARFEHPGDEGTHHPA
ncbi:MAG: DUF4383 domain-containing protein [Rhodocyclales bacterium]|nr:DUF4383 domain-containing protein [Rhodocyclales bacterium]